MIYDYLKPIFMDKECAFFQLHGYKNTSLVLHFVMLITVQMFNMIMFPYQLSLA